MPTIELTQGVQVTRDDEGRVRQLSHPLKVFRPKATTAIAPSPREAAEEYLRERNSLLDLPLADSTNFSAAFALEKPERVEDSLRFMDEKSMTGTATVSYAQTKFGIPVWNAGLTVRLRTTPVVVTGAHNEFHYDADDLRRPGDDAAFMPGRLTAEVLLSLFPSGVLPKDLRLNAPPRLVVFRFEEEERTDPAIKSQDENSIEQCPPTLDLFPLDERIEERHYVVSEALFTLKLDEWGPLNWRAFVEVETGAILYVRALVACAVGKIFPSDPVTLGGDTMSASAPIAILNRLRQDVTLRVGPAGTGGQQALAGTFVKLVDSVGPPHSPPEERTPFEFFYAADTMNFAAVSAFHHCDSLFHLIQDLGLPLHTYFDGTQFPVPVDHFAMNVVNARAPGNARGNGSGGFHFGLAANGSSVGIAADVRVVIHEFGHAILWDHVSSPNFGFAHSPGDSLAAILHDPGSNASDRFETFPFMNASAGLSRRHDREVADGFAWGGRDPPNDTQYGSEQILSTTMFRIYRACGGDDSDILVKTHASQYVAYLILKGVSLLRFTTRDPGVYVAALVESDLATPEFKGQPGAILHKIIRWSFECQGLFQLSNDAPVFSRGEPPMVDVFIDDDERHGEYLPYLQDFPNSTSIWNRHSPDGDANDTHQTPRPGVVNFLYVRVGNRGLIDAQNVEVTAYRATSPEMSWPTHWQRLDSARAPATIPSKREEIIGPIAWTPASGDDTVLISVDADDDASNLAHVVSSPTVMLLVNTDNNLSVRRM